jgi:hypothetical protein
MPVEFFLPGILGLLFSDEYFVPLLFLLTGLFIGEEPSVG